jgi:uncharacterized membrane protein YeiH
MEIVKLLDIIGIIAFSAAGAFAAIDKKLDVFGIFVIAFVTALGGGTLRDVMIGVTPVKWMQDVKLGGVVLATTIIVVLFRNRLKNYHKTLLLFDAFGMSFFTVVGISAGISANLQPPVCIALGTITACFGGVIRDIALNTIPLIFQKKEIYATACILGGILFFMLKGIITSTVVLESICIAVIFAIRLLALKFKWQLPSARS